MALVIIFPLASDHRSALLPTQPLSPSSHHFSPSLVSVSTFRPFLFSVIFFPLLSFGHSFRISSDLAPPLSPTRRPYPLEIFIASHSFFDPRVDVI
jgi:hypothetical protein